jgi:hypothetical protein
LNNICPAFKNGTLPCLRNHMTLQRIEGTTRTTTTPPDARRESCWCAWAESRVVPRTVWIPQRWETFLILDDNGSKSYSLWLRADSHYASRFRSVTVPSSFRQNGLCSHRPSCSVTFQNGTR